MSPPRFATPAVWREPSSLQTPGTLGESELVQLQCRYPCSARTTSRKTGKNGGYISSKMQRFLYPSTWDCLDNYTVQGTLYKPLCILDYCIRLWRNYCGTAVSAYFRAAQLSSHRFPTPFQSKCRHNQFQCLCEGVQPPSLERKWKHLVVPSKGGCE